MATCSWHVKSCWLRIKRRDNSPAPRSPIMVDGSTTDHSTNGLMANSIEVVDSRLKCSWVTPRRFTRCGSTTNTFPLESDSWLLITQQIVSHNSSLFQIHLKVAKIAIHLTGSNYYISWHGMNNTLLGQGDSSCVFRTRTQGTQGSLTLTKDPCLQGSILITRAVFHAYFQESFFLGKEKINRFEFLICYYLHLKDTEKICFDEIQ